MLLEAQPPPAVDFPRDPRDQPFLVATLAAHAGFLVTGDKDLLTAKNLVGVRIVTVAEFCGELEALRLMLTSPEATLLTDDAAARLVAQRLEYEVYETIGVIVRALRRGQRTKRQVLNLLRAVPHRSTLFVQAKLLDSVMEQVNRV